MKFKRFQKFKPFKRLIELIELIKLIEPLKQKSLMYLRRKMKLNIWIIADLRI